MVLVAACSDAAWRFPKNQGTSSFQVPAMTTTFPRRFLATLALLVACTTAQAAVITFEDHTCTDGIADQITNGYGGLNWSNSFHCINGSVGNYTDSGYNAGRVSGTNVAFSTFGHPVEITTTAPGGPKFNVHSAYLTAVFNDGLEVTIEAWRDGALVSTTVHILSATQPTLVQLSLSQVDRVRFTSDGGVSLPAYDDGDPSNTEHFAMDNLNVDFALPSAIPVPTLGEWALALLSLAAAALGLRALRRKQI